MSRKSKVLPEIKVQVVEQFLARVKSIAKILDPSTVRLWVYRYTVFGEEGLITENSSTCYPSKIKLQAVADFLNAKGPMREICIRLNISSHSILRQWIKQYNENGYIELVDSREKHKIFE